MIKNGKKMVIKIYTRLKITNFARPEFNLLGPRVGSPCYIGINENCIQPTTGPWQWRGSEIGPWWSVKLCKQHKAEFTQVIENSLFSGRTKQFTKLQNVASNSRKSNGIQDNLKKSARFGNSTTTTFKVPSPVNVSKSRISSVKERLLSVY